MDERMDCLDRVRIEGAAIVDVLRSADREVVVRAPTLVERLPDPSLCSDPEVLDDVDPVPPERRAVYDPLYARLAEIRAMLEAGRVEPATAMVEQLVTEAEAEGFPGLAARAMAARGQMRLERGQQDDAASDATSAIHYALRAHDDELLASASLGLARALGRTSASTDEALRWLDVAGTAAGRRARGPVRDATLASARVQILLYGDRPSEAERAAREALASLPEDDWARFAILSMLGAAQQQLSRPDEAMATHREAIALAERRGRAEHPGITAALLNLALALQSAGRSADSLPLVERALAIRVAAYGADSPAAADGHRMLGDAHLGMSDLASARREYERALAIGRANHDEAGQLFAAGNLAIVLKTQGDVAGARDLLLEVLPLAEHRFGATSRRVVEISLNLSGYLLELDQIGDAAAHAERALALAEQLESRSVLTLGACIGLAQVYGRQGRTEDALALLDRAAGLGMALLPPTAPEHAHVLLSRAMVLREAGRLAEAAEASSQGADGMERAWGPEGHETIEAQHTAGLSLLESGSPERARARLERALAATASTTVAPTLVARIRWTLARALWPDRSQRTRALALARSARDALRARGDARADEIDAWLADGRGLAPTTGDRAAPP
jgi:tetratricopeptide (TPR) repeat protein